MGSVRHEVRIDAPAEAVWSVVGRPELLHLWFPGIVDCRVAETDDGTIRTITTGAGLEMPERIVTVDRLLRRFQYRITTALFSSHLGTIDVIALAADSSLVVYSTDAEPSVLALTIGGATLAALHELQRQFEAGDGPALQAARRPREELARG